jgi:hypothetical protein
MLTMTALAAARRAIEIAAAAVGRKGRVVAAGPPRDVSEPFWTGGEVPESSARVAPSFPAAATAEGLG